MQQHVLSILLINKESDTVDSHKVQRVRNFILMYKYSGFCHVSRSSGLAKTVLQDIVKTEVDRRRSGMTIHRFWLAQLRRLETGLGGKGLL